MISAVYRDAFNHLHDLESKDDSRVSMHVLFLLSLDSVNRHVSVAIRTIIWHCIALCIRLGEAWVALPTHHPSFADCRQEWGPYCYIGYECACVCVYVCARVSPRVRNIYLSQTGIVCGAIIGHHTQQWWTDWLSGTEILFCRFFHIIVLPLRINSKELQPECVWTYVCIWKAINVLTWTFRHFLSSWYLFLLDERGSALCVCPMYRSTILKVSWFTKPNVFTEAEFGGTPTAYPTVTILVFINQASLQQAAVWIYLFVLC